MDLVLWLAVKFITIAIALNQTLDNNKYQKMFDCLMPADTAIYNQWLNGHLAQGGKITHYSFSVSHFNEDQWYIAKDGLIIQPLYQALAIKIIIPAETKIKIAGLGNNSLYYLKGYRKTKNAPVVLYQ